MRAELLSCPQKLATLGSSWLPLCLVSTLLAELHVGRREAEDHPWKIFNYQTTCVQIKLDTSDNASGLDVILQ